MQYRKIAEVTPCQCPYGGPDNCIGCRYAEGIVFYEPDDVTVICAMDEEE